MLLKLSNELLHEILQYHNFLDLTSLRLTSSRLCDCTERILFKTLSVELLNEQPSPGTICFRRLKFLKAIARGKTHLGKHVQHLAIDCDVYCGTPSNNNKRPNKMMRTLNRIRRVHFRPVDLLAQAAKSLTSIQEIRWSGGARAICPPLDFTNTLQTAFAAVAACCSIRSLKVHDVGRPLPCLTAFSEIEDIAVYGAMPKDSLLALLPGSRPTPLRSITFAARTFDGSKSTQVSVTDLFVNAKATLHSLNLAAVVFPFQSVSLITPLITNLTHLCFSSMSIPDAFWTHLQQDRIHCTTLHVRNVGVTDTLLQYIASYTGLLDLKIISSILYDEPETIGHLPPELGLRFWVDVLPCHTTTLSSLAVADQIVDSSWCLSDEGLEKLAQCRRLRELHVSPHDTHILRSSGSANYLKRLPHMLSLAVWPEMHTIWITNPARDRSAPLTREDYKEDFEHFGESRLHHEIYHSRSCIIW